MVDEVSAGFVVYYESNGKREYLLLHYPSGHWDFPKGHVEKGESLIDAAIRELEEETAIIKNQITIIPGFHEKIEYWYYRKGGKRSHKEVHFFLAKSHTKDVRISFEHKGFIWLPYEEAIKKITYDNAKEVLIKAENYLNKIKIKE